MEVITVIPEIKHEPQLVTHTLKVTGMEGPIDAAKAIQMVGALPGVMDVDADWQKNEVTLTYNLWLVHIEDLEDALIDARLPPDEDFWSRFKLDWIEHAEHRKLLHLREDETLNRMEEHLPWDPNP